MATVKELEAEMGAIKGMLAELLQAAKAQPATATATAPTTGETVIEGTCTKHGVKTAVVALGTCGQGVRHASCLNARKSCGKRVTKVSGCFPCGNAAKRHGSFDFPAK